MRWPPSGPPSRWPGAWTHRTWSSRRRGHCKCSPLSASVTSSPPSRPSPDSTNEGRNAATCASPRPHCGLPRTTRARRPLRWRRSWTAPPPLIPWIWLAHAFLLEASARDALGDQDAAGRAVERALDLAEPDGALLWFLLHPVPGLLERQARHGTAHAALIAEILGLLAGNKPAPPPAGPQLPIEPLSDSEMRVLRYLPTNLSMPQIASELYVSHNTVKTHISHLYAKLGTHTRAEAVARARALGLLAPSPLRGKATRAG